MRQTPVTSRLVPLTDKTGLRQVRAIPQTQVRICFPTHLLHFFHILCTIVGTIVGSWHAGTLLLISAKTSGSRCVAENLQFPCSESKSKNTAVATSVSASVLRTTIAQGDGGTILLSFCSRAICQTSSLFKYCFPHCNLLRSEEKSGHFCQCKNGQVVR